MGLTHPLKPHVIVSDQGAAFLATHFTDFLNSRQIAARYSCTYTPKQNHWIEQIWGPTFGYARTLLIGANQGPGMHPFAVQPSNWILCRLPQPTRGNVSPYFTLTRRPASLRFLRAYGCFARITIPAPRRVGDRHFADRGAPAIYLGPSETTPGAVVMNLITREISTTPDIVCYEDQFPGLKGDFHAWMPDDTSHAGLDAPPTPTVALNPAPASATSVPPAPAPPTATTTSATFDDDGYSGGYSPFRPSPGVASSSAPISAPPTPDSHAGRAPTPNTPPTQSGRILEFEPPRPKLALREIAPHMQAAAEFRGFQRANQTGIQNPNSTRTTRHGSNYVGAHWTTAVDLAVQQMNQVTIRNLSGGTQSNYPRAQLTVINDKDSTNRWCLATFPSPFVGEPLVLKLNRSLYGLRQAGREWNVLLVGFIIEYGFVQSQVDVCLFMYSKDCGYVYV